MNQQQALDILRPYVELRNGRWQRVFDKGCTNPWISEEVKEAVEATIKRGQVFRPPRGSNFYLVGIVEWGKKVKISLFKTKKYNVGLFVYPHLFIGDYIKVQVRDLDEDTATDWLSEDKSRDERFHPFHVFACTPNRT